QDGLWPGKGEFRQIRREKNLSSGLPWFSRNKSHQLGAQPTIAIGYSPTLLALSLFFRLGKLTLKFTYFSHRESVALVTAQIARCLMFHKFCELPHRTFSPLLTGDFFCAFRPVYAGSLHEFFIAFEPLVVSFVLFRRAPQFKFRLA